VVLRSTQARHQPKIDKKVEEAEKKVKNKYAKDKQGKKDQEIEEEAKKAGEQAKKAADENWKKREGGVDTMKDWVSMNLGGSTVPGVTQ